MLVNLSGLLFEIQFCWKESREHFEEFEVQEGSPMAVIRASKKDFAQAEPFFPEKASEDVKEWIALRRCFADILPVYGRCLFHGAALVFDGSVYLFTAPCGTGKTTQLILWRRMFPERTEIINGDKPILEFSKDGSVLVHPSPWKGKENCGYAPAAPLAAVVYLKQAKHDCIYSMPRREAVISLFYQFFCSKEGEEELLKICGFLDQMVRCIPIWKLENQGGFESVKVCFEALKSVKCEKAGGKKICESEKA